MATDLERNLMRWGSIALWLIGTVGLSWTVGQTWSPWAGWAVFLLAVAVPFVWTLREIREDAADRAEQAEAAPDTGWAGPSAQPNGAAIQRAAPAQRPDFRSNGITD